MRKDAPLVEAAWEADHTVVSTDKKARGLFGELSASVESLRSIVWVNPDEEPEQVMIWLERGARPRQNWLLGSR